MSDVVIQVEKLSKRYRIGSQRSLGKTFSEALGDSVKRWIRPGSPAADSRDYWAVNGVSFEVQRGEVLGIIGGNGAGKSTLLKLLSRITLPTTGQARVRGRLASLLEVGTGFHPELSGRENIYLNGTILGMRKAEIDAQFDAIVDFAEVSAFLDTPVKRYSSGMYTRLAFAVAAHLNPEIVVVDEVLAVGDEAFQRKCGSRMRQTADGGRTVLLVSHNMGLIQRLCDRTLWLEKGQVRQIGETDAVVAAYTDRQPTDLSDTDLATAPRNAGHGVSTRITRCRVLDSRGQPTRQLRFGEPFAIDLKAAITSRDLQLSTVIGIDTASGQRVVTAISGDHGAYMAPDPAGTGTIRAQFDELRLVPGTYQLALQLRRDRTALDTLIGVVDFRVLAATWGSTAPHTGAMGVVASPVTWTSADAPALEVAA